YSRSALLTLYLQRLALRPRQRYLFPPHFPPPTPFLPFRPPRRPDRWPHLLHRNPPAINRIALYVAIHLQLPHRPLSHLRTPGPNPPPPPPTRQTHHPRHHRRPRWHVHPQPAQPPRHHAANNSGNAPIPAPRRDSHHRR